MNQQSRWRNTALFLLTCLSFSGAWATLGQMPLAGAQNMTVSGVSSYSTWTSALPTGTTVREFTNAAGLVFAVRWEGPLLPDMGLLLGAYASEYQQAVQRQRDVGLRGGGLQAQKPYFVMLSRGRMGQFSGHAYLPAQVPAGVDMEALLQ